MNDRGPFIKGRIIDLSRAAAEELGMMAQGIANVTVEPAYGITIPLRPSMMEFELPRLIFESIELKDTLKPIWQEDLLIDHKKIQHRVNRTVKKVGNATKRSSR